MRLQLKRLTTDTAIYGISTIIGRFLNFLLVPLYTNLFSRAEYGIVSTIFSYLAFSNVIFGLGMEAAFMRYYSTLDAGTKKETFSAPFLSVAAFSLFVSLVIYLRAPSLYSFLQIDPRWSMLIPLAAGTLAIDALCVLPFALLRMENKAWYFVWIKTLAIIVTVALNIWFLGIQKLSIEYIFVAGIIGSGISLVCLLPVIFKNLSFKLPRGILNKMFLLGLPTLPAGLAGIILQVVDRPLMLYLTNAETVGLYQANYKLGIFMMLIISMFQYAWQPFYLQTAKESNARTIFSRVLTYFVLCTSAIFLCLTLFLEPIVKFSIFQYHLLGKEYWAGLFIVPFILLSYIFTGIGIICSAGLLIEKKTKTMPIVMGLSAGLNIVINIVLIPPLGILGGALATLMSYVAMALLYWRFNQSVYPIAFEYRRLFKISLALSVALLPVFLQWNPIPTSETIWRIVLLLSFPMLLVVFRFFEPNESVTLRQWLRIFSFLTK